MGRQITIFHGSPAVVDHPLWDRGNPYRDYGPGFYCTENEEIAKEWAVSAMSDGYCNRYTLDTEYLRILNLSSPDYTILNWITILIEHRIFAIRNPAHGRAKKYLSEHFSVNVNAFDLIIGYRADDSYFSFAEAFLNNAISVEQLARAMRLGNLGEQVVIKSRFAFQQLNFEEALSVSSREYYSHRNSRNSAANQIYDRILSEETDGLYIQDIIRGKITNEDPRIPRNVSEQGTDSSRRCL